MKNKLSTAITAANARRKAKREKKEQARKEVVGASVFIYFTCLYPTDAYAPLNGYSYESPTQVWFIDPKIDRALDRGLFSRQELPPHGFNGFQITPIPVSMSNVTVDGKPVMKDSNGVFSFPSHKYIFVDGGFHELTPKFKQRVWLGEDVDGNTVVHITDTM